MINSKTEIKSSVKSSVNTEPKTETSSKTKKSWLYILNPISSFNKIYKKTSRFIYNAKDLVVETVSNAALNKIIKSEYLRDNGSIVPLMLLTTTIRSVFNFLIVSRLQTQYYLIDLPVSICVTVGLALSSPFIYNHISKVYGNEINNFSSHVIDSYWNEGWDYIERWKSRIFGSIGITSIILLFFIKVDSFMIQEFIFHTMLSSIIVDNLCRYRPIIEDNLSKINFRNKTEQKQIEEIKETIKKTNSFIFIEDYICE